MYKLFLMKVGDDLVSFSYRQIIILKNKIGIQRATKAIIYETVIGKKQKVCYTQKIHKDDQPLTEARPNHEHRNKLLVHVSNCLHVANICRRIRQSSQPLEQPLFKQGDKMKFLLNFSSHPRLIKLVTAP